MHNILIYFVTSCLYNDTSHVLIHEYVNFKIIFKVHFIVYIYYIQAKLTFMSIYVTV